ncbi:MAG: ATP-grasp domain-containing protein [Planctomycetaceae bacterium]|nr:ATP-grasp domain-containing protein [Planctomycetaceae bacterium]
MNEPLIILGASARAAAYSAARAGFAPWAADLFADADLARLCPVVRIERYPCDFGKVVGQAPPGPWMYTGGLENYPAVVERIHAVRPLLGCAGATLRRARDPWALAELARRAGLPAPELALAGAALPRDGSWLRKALRSSGGLHVRFWDADHPAPAERRGWYFQQRILGDSHAAVFVADGQRSVCLGITRQFVGGDDELGSAAGAPRFHYAGSVGPVSVPLPVQAALARLGETLTAEWRLEGLFGVDFVLAGTDGWPLELNPRFPASVEVLERARGFSAVGWHVSACRDRLLYPPPSDGSERTCAGKVVLYALGGERMDEDGCAALLARNPQTGAPQIADIPAEPGKFRQGEPLLTLLAEGNSPAMVTAQLTARIAELRSWYAVMAVARGPG